MCVPAAALPLVAAIGAGVSAVGTGFAALSANAQHRYNAKIAERNAAMEREAGQQEIQNTREAALAQYRRIAQIKGQQRLAAGAGGVSLDFGTAADTAADTDMLAREDMDRLYRQGAQNLRGRDIAASNFMGEANAQRQAGTGALVKGAFDMGSTVLSGAQQYRAMKDKIGGASFNRG
jgi:hypothetical protein